MWKARPEDNKPMTPNPSQPSQPGAASNAAASPTPSMTVPPKDNPKPAPSFSERADVGHIGKSVVIRGELTGNEDLYLDGDIEGTIDLRDHKLVIGPNGKIKASITARELVVHGRLEGNVAATDRVELKKSCTLIGDVGTQRIMIEDGAFFKGAIDIKDGAQRKPAAPSFPTSVGSGMSSGTAYSAAPASQGSFLDPK
jgi:cytoskeletal protein CcmA (bactofilin family)